MDGWLDGLTSERLDRWIDVYCRCIDGEMDT